MGLTQIELKEEAHACSKKIQCAVENADFFEFPYKHLVLDNFFSNRLAQRCLDHFPGMNESSWEFANDKDIEIKYRSLWQSEFDIPEGIVDAVRVLNSAPILRAMSDRFKIQKIIPDPYFTGGGLNVTKSGGLLDVHVDGNYHDATGLNRRLNALVYLNPNWQSGWGGEFGVYDEKGEVCLKEIAPLFNRLIIFDTHDKSFHGLPSPLNFPPDELRRSILLYYYTKEPRPDSQVAIIEPHSALWKKRNLNDKRGNKTREYD